MLTVLADERGVAAQRRRFGDAVESVGVGM